MKGAMPPAVMEEMMAGRRRKKNCRREIREKRRRMDGVGAVGLCGGGTTSTDEVGESKDFLKSTGLK